MCDHKLAMEEEKIYRNTKMDSFPNQVNKEWHKVITGAPFPFKGEIFPTGIIHQDKLKD